MRILIFHGYLLRGTGSNIYNANLVRALAALGHEVHLFCQDPDADRLAATSERTGITRFALLVEGSGDLATTEENVRRLGTEVLPQLT